MKATVGSIRCLIREATGLLLSEVRCRECNDDNEYAEPNQSDGSFVCRKCRDLLGIKTSSRDNPLYGALPNWRDYKDDIPVKYVKKHWPRALDAWHINSDKDDMFSVDGEAQLWVEPGFGQPAWRWDEKDDTWIQEEPQ